MNKANKLIGKYDERTGVLQMKEAKHKMISIPLHVGDRIRIDEEKYGTTLIFRDAIGVSVSYLET